MIEKKALRTAMRAQRAGFVASIPEQMRALVLNRPPSEISDYLQDCPTLGLFHAIGDEAPSLGWIRWFHENGWKIALPRFASKSAAMEFRLWQNPWDEGQLEPGLLGIPQPRSDAPSAEPDAVIVPLIAFTADCARLGQGGGHYDRWFAEHRPKPTVGLAWDLQRVDNLPLEPHDQPLDAVVTPTRIYWRET